MVAQRELQSTLLILVLAVQSTWSQSGHPPLTTTSTAAYVPDLGVTDVPESKPKVFVPPPGKLSVVVPYGTTEYTLRCIVDANPLPQVYWLFNGKEFGKVMIHQHGDHQVEFAIRIPIESDTVEGKYDCVARNTFGSHHVSYNLEIQGLFGHMKTNVAGFFQMLFGREPTCLLFC